VRAENATALLAGFVFAIGLGISGMLQPEVILGFLDVAGAWNPAPLVVMGIAASLYFVASRLARRRGRSVLGGALRLPVERPLDGRLLAGAAIFGMGWGLGGLCPGPAVTVAPVRPDFLAFGGALLVGVLLGEVLRTRGSSAG